MPSGEPRSTYQGGAEDWLAKIGLPREQADVSRAPHAPADGPLTRDRILATAEEVIRRFGSAEATVVDVARALGVSHAAWSLLPTGRRPGPAALPCSPPAAGHRRRVQRSVAAADGRAVRREKRQSDRRYGIAASTPLFTPSDHLSDAFAGQVTFTKTSSPFLSE
jgi:hypothetical protein